MTDYMETEGAPRPPPDGDATIPAVVLPQPYGVRRVRPHCGLRDVPSDLLRHEVRQRAHGTPRHARRESIGSISIVHGMYARARSHRLEARTV